MLGENMGLEVVRKCLKCSGIFLSADSARNAGGTAPVRKAGTQAGTHGIGYLEESAETGRDQRSMASPRLAPLVEKPPKYPSSGDSVSLGVSLMLVLFWMP